METTPEFTQLTRRGNYSPPPSDNDGSLPAGSASRQLAKVLEDAEGDVVQVASPSTDASSAYVEGERAAYARALTLVVPSQQQLGALRESVNLLSKEVAASAQMARASNERAVSTAARVEEIRTSLERLPNLEASVAGATAACDAQQRVLDAFATEWATRIAQQTKAKTDFGDLSKRASRVAYAMLCAADVSALALARAVLAHASAPVAEATSNALGRPAPGTAENIIAAAVLLAGVEMTHAAQRYAQRRIGTLGGLLRPLGVGVGVARGVLWASAGNVAVHAAKDDARRVANSLVRHWKGEAAGTSSAKAASNIQPAKGEEGQNV